MPGGIDSRIDQALADAVAIHIAQAVGRSALMHTPVDYCNRETVAWNLKSAVWRPRGPAPRQWIINVSGMPHMEIKQISEAPR